jgi:hypothetical protein
MFTLRDATFCSSTIKGDVKEREQEEKEVFVNKNESWEGEMGGRERTSPPGDSAMNSWINSHRRRGGKTGACKYLSRSFLHKKIPHLWRNWKIQCRVKNPV